MQKVNKTDHKLIKENIAEKKSYLEDGKQGPSAHCLRQV